ncbi:MAG: ComEA family DNA-binding protein [Acidobacteriaceae bacterium]
MKTQSRTIRLALLAVALLLLPTGFATAQGTSSAKATATSKAAAAKATTSSDLLDINTATAAQLKVLPGVGDVYAAKIIAGRPYTAKNQLVTRGILPKNVYSGISAKIIAHRVKK